MFKIAENKLRYFLSERVLFYIRETTSIAMRTITLTAQHCLSLAAIMRQGASVVWSGFRGYQLVKSGPEIALDNRTQEVRG
jgi:hypothetical protein